MATVPRVTTGVSGLDEMLQGGIPQGHVVLVLGTPGVGKTCLALQFVASGAARGEKTLYLSFEEEPDALLAAAAQFGWSLTEATKKGLLKIVRVDPQDASNALKRIKSQFPQEVQSFGPKRMVIDSISLLSALSSDEVERRNVLFTIARMCRQAGATTLLTAEANPLAPEVSRDGMGEYVSDGVLLLAATEDPQAHRAGLAMKILKMRRTGHVRTRQPYKIGPRGIEVDARAVDFGGL
ncbi:MAG: AAA family ATPase [Euryarchaeota archaeon]|nr:AAA family ATPase [Euryarchaeota archaeon]MDE1835423.1 AAA family ATPase [Euryarchaeota archaeon]MDE1879559.1 AAA family ATPase [Euryarchaeota archaeon]MDE2046074.1 AAA family ATPase [Thermoplasmata archaeon]